MGFNSKYSGITVENLLDKIPKDNTIIHSGNIGGYALKFYPYDWTSNVYNANDVQKNQIINHDKWTNTPISSIASLLDLSYSKDWRTQLFFCSGNKTAYLRFRYNGTTWSDWKTIAFTDSNVASAQALIHSNGTVGATINSSGNVGIGTISPNAKLDVNGDIHTTGSLTQDSDINLKNKVRDVSLSIDEIAESPLFEFTYKSDKDKRVHVGTSAQYWASKNNWFCSKQDNGYYDMEIQNCALASAISIAREFKRYKEESSETISELQEEIKMLKEVVSNIKLQLKNSID